MTGFAIDIADNMAGGEQTTTVHSASSATVSQTITNVSKQHRTGYYNGRLTVRLDENLSPSGIPELTVRDRQDRITAKVKGAWNAADHTIMFSGTGFRGWETGWKASYSIDCTVKPDSGAKKFTNSFMLSGDLRSQDEETGVCIDDLHSGKSTAVPMYTLTVRMDGETMEKAETRQGADSADKILGTVDSRSAVVTDSAGKKWHTASYDVTYGHYISSTPSILTGCDFVKWVELMNSTGVTTDRKPSSKYVNDSTYAYERQMPASGMTISAVGKVCYYDTTRQGRERCGIGVRGRKICVWFGYQH